MTDIFVAAVYDRRKKKGGGDGHRPPLQISCGIALVFFKETSS